MNLVSTRFAGSGIHTDSETCDHAKIMLFSVIPLIIILIPRAFGVSYSSQEYNIVALLSLFMALFCLCCYFYYQVCIWFNYCIKNIRSNMKMFKNLVPAFDVFFFLGINFFSIKIRGYIIEYWSMQNLKERSKCMYLIMKYKRLCGRGTNISWKSKLRWRINYNL